MPQPLRMSRQRGILGLKKDPKHQLLFMFQVPKGEEWPSSDSGDSDYSPQTESKGTSWDSDTMSDSDSEDNFRPRKRSQKQSSSRQNANSKSTRKQKASGRKRAATQEGSKTKNKRLKRSAAGKSATSSKTTGKELQDDEHAGNGELSAATSLCSKVPHMPPELWLKIFQYSVSAHGPLPFLCRAAKVCQGWSELAAHPSLWQKVDLSYGWVKSTDQTLRWLAQNRLSQCREISLSGWKNVTNDAFKELCTCCPHLESVNLSNCSKLTSSSVLALITDRPQLKELDLSFMHADAVSAQSLKQVAAKLGARLTSLTLAGNNLVGFNLVLNTIMDNCLNLDTLDLCNCRFSTDFFILNVEKLQASCPNLRVLRLANCKIRGSQASQYAQEQSHGFVKLQQLSCAMPVSDSPTIGNGVPDELLNRLLHKADKLQLLDLRGCTNFNLITLVGGSFEAMEQLYLSHSSASRQGNTLCLLLQLWSHTLKTVDLAWTSPSENDMFDAIKALTSHPRCPVTILNLAGTPVTLHAVRLALDHLALESLDLTSCRSLPRGIKCLHQGVAAIQKLRSNFCTVDPCSSDTDSY